MVDVNVLGQDNLSRWSPRTIKSGRQGKGRRRRSEVPHVGPEEVHPVRITFTYQRYEIRQLRGGNIRFGHVNRPHCSAMTFLNDVACALRVALHESLLAPARPLNGSDLSNKQILVGVALHKARGWRRCVWRTARQHEAICSKSCDERKISGV